MEAAAPNAISGRMLCVDKPALSVGLLFPFEQYMEMSNIHTADELCVHKLFLGLLPM